jgi:hypothetical protein
MLMHYLIKILMIYTAYLVLYKEEEVKSNRPGGNMSEFREIASGYSNLYG